MSSDVAGLNGVHEALGNKPAISPWRRAPVAVSAGVDSSTLHAIVLLNNLVLQRIFTVCDVAVEVQVAEHVTSGSQELIACFFWNASASASMVLISFDV